MEQNREPSTRPTNKDTQSSRDVTGQSMEKG